MGQIKVTKNVGDIEGLCIIEPAVHGDERGYFMETYNQREMEEAGFHINFVQDNQSMSTKGVLRGLHFQKHYPQCKLVRVVRGSVFDVAAVSYTHLDVYKRQTKGRRTIFTASLAKTIEDRLKKTWFPKQIAQSLKGKVPYFKTIYNWIHNKRLSVDEKVLRRKGKPFRTMETRGKFLIGTQNAFLCDDLYSGSFY